MREGKRTSDPWQPDWERHLECTSKIRHATKAEAMRVASAKNRRRGHTENRAYKCKHCHGYHLTSAKGH